MNIIETKLEGCYEIQSQPFNDSRGTFLNVFRIQAKEFKQIWNARNVKQVNLSKSNRLGTIRGLHMQIGQYSEAKLIRCIKGKVWDVAVDLRPKSNTYGEWVAIELSSSKYNAILIPEGFAHGFQSLEPESELLYLHSGDWIAESEYGVRWNDPTLNIPWPLRTSEISDRDKSLPLLNQ